MPGWPLAPKWAAPPLPSVTSDPREHGPNCASRRQNLSPFPLLPTYSPPMGSETTATAESGRRTEWFVWAGILLTAIVIFGAFGWSKLQQGQMPDLRPIGELPSFTLTNQDGRAVSLADLRGQVWVADIIFSRCAGPCPVMTQHMSELQKILPAKNPVRLVTLTTDPEFDGPEVLKRYGERFQADFNRWSFLTGTKREIGRLAVDGMKLAAMEKPPQERETERDLFIHSELFVFIDKQGRLRGSVESYDPKMKRKVLAAVKELCGEN